MPAKAESRNLNRSKILKFAKMVYVLILFCYSTQSLRDRKDQNGKADLLNR